MRPIASQSAAPDTVWFASSVTSFSWKCANSASSTERTAPRKARQKCSVPRAGIGPPTHGSSGHVPSDSRNRSGTQARRDMVMVNDKLFNEGRRAGFPYPSVTTKSGPLKTAEALAGIAASKVAARRCASAGLSITIPSSVFRRADRGSKLNEPTKMRAPSAAYVLACRLARDEAPGAPLARSAVRSSVDCRAAPRSGSPDGAGCGCPCCRRGNARPGRRRSRSARRSSRRSSNAVSLPLRGPSPYESLR